MVSWAVAHASPYDRHRRILKCILGENHGLYAEYERISLLFLLVQSDAAHAHHHLSYFRFKANGKIEAVKHARWNTIEVALPTFTKNGQRIF